MPRHALDDAADDKASVDEATEVVLPSSPSPSVARTDEPPPPPVSSAAEAQAASAVPALQARIATLEREIAARDAQVHELNQALAQALAPDAPPSSASDAAAVAPPARKDSGAPAATPSASSGEVGATVAEVAAGAAARVDALERVLARRDGDVGHLQRALAELRTERDGLRSRVAILERGADEAREQAAALEKQAALAEAARRGLEEVRRGCVGQRLCVFVVYHGFSMAGPAPPRIASLTRIISLLASRRRSHASTLATRRSWPWHASVTSASWRRCARRSQP